MYFKHTKNGFMGLLCAIIVVLIVNVVEYLPGVIVIDYEGLQMFKDGCLEGCMLYVFTYGGMVLFEINDYNNRKERKG
jgi:hypothetical protein